MITLPGILTFAALSLLALIAGVSLTRLVPGLAGQHPGLLALGLLMLFWAVREKVLRHIERRRLVAEIDALSDELARLRGEEQVEEIAPVATNMPRAEPRLVANTEVAPAPVDDGTLLEAVRDALNNNRVELHVQPIVSLPQRRIRFFELLARPRDAAGRAYQAAECLNALEAAGLRAEFDALMLLRGVQMVRKLEHRAKDAGFFLNLSPAMLAQIETFDPLFDFLQRDRERAGNIVLEFVYDGIRRLDRSGLYRLSQLAALGYAISIDGVDQLDVDFAGLAKAGVRFMKFDAQVLLDPEVAARAPISLADLREACTRQGITPVLAKVESEAELVQLSELDFPFGQGMLFGAPKLARAA
ncbi:EAL domain-containing protein [uncultured Ferrovibrio sp.]|jgi:cyclic-di-GMP phosphodiesterase TipF (flagellum assembly factor)|uniref:EAL domain-containing protein n=1 Tax=uncultured Ferrovibrio sp. TaxID=1576913 RepID=UPI00261EC5D8|nr:EAL domain-containing protein [uncultured Ferrovibrio sp.]